MASPQRGRRNEKSKDDWVFVCNELEDGVLVPFPPPPPAYKGKGKAVVEASSSHPPVVHANEKDPKSLRKLPKFGQPLEMFSWTIEQYHEYDEYLIAKWERFGELDPSEKTYVSIRDPRSKVVSVIGGTKQ